MAELNLQKLKSLLSKMSQKDIISGTEMPENPDPYQGWQVISPITGKSECLRVFATLTEIVDLYDLNVPVPRKWCWFTAIINKEAVEYKNSIPFLDEAFQPDPKHLMILLDVLNNPTRPGSGKGYYGFGEAGVGKTSTALWLFAVTRTAIVHLNCKSNMEMEEFFISQVAHNGVWDTYSGPVLQAVERNWPLLADELDLAPAEFLPAMNNLIEGRSFAIPYYKDKVIRAKSFFHLVAFGNTGSFGAEIGNYSGRNQMDSSFLDRLYKDHYDPLSVEKLTALIIKQLPGEEDLAQRLAKFAFEVNKGVSEGSLVEQLSPRQLVALITLYKAERTFLKYPMLYALGHVLSSMIECSGQKEKIFSIYSTCLADSALDVAEISQNWENRYEPTVEIVVIKNVKAKKAKAS